MDYLKYLLIVVMMIEVCTSSCPIDCSQVQCVQGYSPFLCPDDTIYTNNGALCGCCPACIRLREPGESCEGETSITFDIQNYYTTTKTYDSTGNAPIVQSMDCAPGLSCIGAKCTDYTYDCVKNQNPNALWSPDCDIDGSFKPVQCKDNGADPRCFCYSKTGKRIFGFDWIGNRDKMHCLCSRLVNDLMNSVDDLDTSFHCSSNGNFEPLQCNRGSCYCADIYTGQPTSIVVPEPLWTILTCYNETTMGSNYLKTCDSQSNALAVIMKEAAQHGSQPITLQAPPCDADGSYLSKQCDSSQCYCRTRANVNIGSYFTARNSEASTKQNCYCARDEVIFNDVGRAFSYQCDNGGNYNPLQTIGNQAFCVDADGFMATELVPIEQKCDGKLAQCVDIFICPSVTVSG